jgi:hypothetical protein
MDEVAIGQYITTTFDGITTVSADGNLFFFYDPEQMFPFATLMINDVNDQFSDLSRPSIYRLNIGVSKETFRSLFPQQTFASDEDLRESGYDFTVLDQVMPHPVYGRMHWVCILNPSTTTFETIVRPLLAEAYERDVSKHTKRAARKS